ncbi:MAG TPA: hypothetical protein VIL60_01765 [Rhodanobacter sp.]
MDPVADEYLPTQTQLSTHNGIVDDVCIRSREDLLANIATQVSFARTSQFIASFHQFKGTRMSYRIAGFLVACIVAASAWTLAQRVTVPPANFHYAAIHFLSGPDALPLIQLDEIRLDTALRDARSAMQAEGHFRTVGNSGALGPNQRALGKADATRGVIAFQQEEIERLSMDIEHRADVLAEDVNRLDALWIRDCHRGEAAMDCGGDALGTRYRIAREDALTGARQAIAHARTVRAQVKAMATARPAGISLRSSSPGPVSPGKWRP